MSNNNSKMITIQSRGFVMTSRGRVMTPIRTPYRESTSRIWSMLNNDHADIYERLKDGTDLKLTPQNFDTDNNAVATAPVELKPVQAPIKTQPDPVPPAVVEEKKELETAPELPAASVEETPVNQEDTVADEASEVETAPELPATPVEDAEEVSDDADTQETEEDGDEEDAAEDKKEADDNQISGGKKKHRNRNKKKFGEPTAEEKKADSASLAVPVDEA